MEPIQEQDLGKQGGAHWSAHPWKLLGWTIAALLVANLIEVVVAFALAPLTNNPSLWPVSNLYNVITPVLWLALLAVFYNRVRTAQRKHGMDEKPCWRPDAVFLIGLGLLLLAALLHYMPVGSRFFNLPLITYDFLGNAASGLGMLLVYHLLVPSFDKRMGLLKSALALGVGFAALAVLERICGNIMFVIYNGIINGQQSAIPSPSASSFLSVFFPGTLLPLCVSAFALAAVRTALYQRASRSMPGAWMFFSAIPPLLALPYSAISNAVHHAMRAPSWLMPSINVTYYLIIFAVGLALIRWKTFGAFWKDTKVFARWALEKIRES